MVVLAATVWLWEWTRFLIRFPFTVVGWFIYFVYAAFALVFSIVWSVFNGAHGAVEFTANKFLEKTLFKVYKTLDDLYDENVEGNSDYDKGSKYFLKLIFKSCRAVGRWGVLLGNVFLKSINFILYFVAVALTFGVILSFIIYGESNLEKGVQITNVIWEGFKSFINFLSATWNTFGQLLVPFLPVFFKLIAFLRIQAIIITNAFFNLMGLSQPIDYAGRILRQNEQISLHNNRDWSGRRLEQSFFAEGQISGPDLSATVDDIEIVVSGFYQMVFVHILTILNIFAELFFNLFVGILRGVDAFIGIFFVGATCCGQYPLCCFFELFGNLIGIGLLFPFGSKLLVGRVVKLLSKIRFSGNNPRPHPFFLWEGLPL